MACGRHTAADGLSSLGSARSPCEWWAPGDRRKRGLCDNFPELRLGLARMAVRAAGAGPWIGEAGARFG